MLGSPYSPERLLALAGIAGCAHLIDELATSGQADEEEIAFFVSAFLDSSPESGERTLQPNPSYNRAIRLLTNFPQGNNEKQQRILIYSMQSIQLMQHFMKRRDLLDQLTEELPQIALEEPLENQLLSMGSLYEKTVSTLPFRIQIQGSQGYLRQPLVAQKIRGLLFCAIRFALLWQQNGGSKFDFLLRKANIRQLAREALRI